MLLFDSLLCLPDIIYVCDLFTVCAVTLEHSKVLRRTEKRGAGESGE